jgi:hypothetical protein
MKAIQVAAIGAVFVSLGVFSSATAATVLAKGLFSYEAPPGWSVCLHADSNLEIAQAGKSGSDYGEIRVSILKSDSSIHDFMVAGLRRLETAQKARVVSRQPFLTAAGLDGFRLVLEGPLLAGADEAPTCRVLYFFDGGSNQKIIVEGTCPRSLSSRYLPLIDAAMKTFSLE